LAALKIMIERLLEWTLEVLQPDELIRVKTTSLRGVKEGYIVSGKTREVLFRVIRKRSGYYICQPLYSFLVEGSGINDYSAAMTLSYNVFLALSPISKYHITMRLEEQGLCTLYSCESLNIFDLLFKTLYKLKATTFMYESASLAVQCQEMSNQGQLELARASEFSLESEQKEEEIDDD
jgi:hypothetical protein